MPEDDTSNSSRYLLAELLDPLEEVDVILSNLEPVLHVGEDDEER